MMIRTLTIAGTSLLIAGCATFAITDATDPTLKSHSPVIEPQRAQPGAKTVVNRALCSRWLRDLTVAWSQRQYYCKDNDTSHTTLADNTHRRLRDLSVASVKHYVPTEESTDGFTQNATHSKPVVAIQLSSTEASPADKVERDSAPPDREPSAAFMKAVITPKRERATLKKAAVPVRDAVQKLGPDPLPQGLSYNIPFANAIEVLGPKGKAATDRIARLIASRPNVVLRGFAYERDSEAANDQLAVARGLAVRKRLAEAGHEYHLKILFRQQDIDPDGRKVTVTIR